MRALPQWPHTRPLRKWQQQALQQLLAAEGQSNFLASVTPAAGKTTFGLRVAHEFLQSGKVSRVVVLAPTTHIARQWAADAARYGIDLEPNRPNSEGIEPADRHGIAVTYQTVSAGSAVHRAGCARATLLIADEPHHMGEDAAWGQNTVTAFAKSRFRLLLSGTPFRSDNSPIPWVNYSSEGISQADFTYTYTDALLDGVCRPITCQAYEGDMEWISDGRRRSANFSVALPATESARRLRTALDAEGDWIVDLLRDADLRLSQVRSHGHPEAGGLVIARDKEHATALARQLEVIGGVRPDVVTSDEADASKRIAAFAAGNERWLVSVLMVSEGVDIPRLRVGVYATAARTELFFRQVVGRFIRRTPQPRAQMSYLLLPADPTLKRLAGQVEEERKHALQVDPNADFDQEPPQRSERSEPQDRYQALVSESARPDEEIIATTNPGDALQLFATESTIKPPAAAVVAAIDQPGYLQRESLRDQRQRLVARLARKTGQSHSAVHSWINQQTGAKSVADASVEQLQRGNTLLERKLSV